MKIAHRSQSGFTLVEITIILVVLVILSMIMLPQLGNFNRLARKVKVNEDLQAICSTMKKLLDEVMLGTFYEDPAQRVRPVGLLVGPGKTPSPGSAGDGTCSQCATPQQLHWLQAAGQTGLNMGTDDAAETESFETGFLQDHLQQNNPDPNDGSKHYKNAIDNPERWAVGAFSGWRGPYVNDLDTDP